MRFSNIISSLFLSAITVSAAVIPATFDGPKALEPRNEPMPTILTFISKNNSRYQVRVLGRVRIVPQLRDAVYVTNMGAELAKSYFEDFIQQAHLQETIRNSYRGLTALYKDFSSKPIPVPIGPMPAPVYDSLMGVLGFQLEIIPKPGEVGPSERALNNLIIAMETYFKDTVISIGQNFVYDAFNIGGPFKTPDAKRSLGHEKRDVCPAGFDFASVFYSTGTWNPDSTLYGVPMCSDF